jgi:hypothetical protein
MTGSRKTRKCERNGSHQGNCRPNNRRAPDTHFFWTGHETRHNHTGCHEASDIGELKWSKKTVAEFASDWEGAMDDIGERAVERHPSRSESVEKGHPYQRTEKVDHAENVLAHT